MTVTALVPGISAAEDHCMQQGAREFFQTFQTQGTDAPAGAGALARDFRALAAPAASREPVRLAEWLNWRVWTCHRTGPRTSGGRAGRTLRTGTPGCSMRPNGGAGRPTGATRTARGFWPDARWRRPCSPGTPACGRPTCASTGPATSAASRTASRSSRAASSRAALSRAGSSSIPSRTPATCRGRGRADPGRRGRRAA